MSDAVAAAWRRGAFPYAYALSLVELTPAEDAQHPYRADAPPLEQAQLWHDHGRMCWQLAKLDEAEATLQRALEIRRPILGADDLLTLDTAERLAAVASARGNDDLGTERFAQVLAGLMRTVADESVRLAIARRNLAAHHRTFGRYGVAEAALNRAMEVLGTALPPEDPAHVDGLKVRAQLLLQQGMYAQAVAVAERAIKLGTAAWDVDHPFVAAAHLTAATAERLNGHGRSARRRLASVITCFERCYGPHPLTAIALHQLARVELDDRNHDLAEDLARRAMPMYRAFHPSGFIATIATTLIRIAAERGKFATALALVNEVEPLAHEPFRHAPRYVLASAQYATGRVAEALANLRRARELAPPDQREDFDAEIEAWAHEVLG